MTEIEDNPCPCELDNHISGISAVQDNENLIKVVAIREHIVPTRDGGVQLTATAISQQDIAGRVDASGSARSISTFRAELAPREELVRRAKSINKVTEWFDDPISAAVLAKALRSIIDNAGRREVCVYAEPTGAEDKLGPCPTHAGFKRSLAPPIPHDKLQWAVLRLTVAQKFTEFKHMCSDSDVTATTINMSL